MLFKKQAHGKTLTSSKPLLTSVSEGYLRPPENGNDWFQTSTTIWRVDELIKRRVRDWRRLTGEDGHTGARSETMREDHDSAYTGSHSVFPAPLVEWILLRYGGPPGGRILDAFAGGPVRAVVSTIMGYSYCGFEIRQEQIDENIRALSKLELVGASFILGDGRFLDLPISDSNPNMDRVFDCALTCHPASVNVLTTKGLKSISRIEVGDEVISGYGGVKVVTETLEFIFTGGIFELERDYTSIPLRATPEHPLLVRRGEVVNWMLVKDLRKGDCLLEPIPTEPDAPNDGDLIAAYIQPTGRGKNTFKGKDRIHITADLTRLIGYYLSQGSISNRTVSLAFNSDKTDIQNTAIKSLIAVFGNTASATKRKHANVSVVSGHSSLVPTIFDDCGRGAAHKRFPSWVWGCSNDLLKELLTGLFIGGDGWIETNGTHKTAHSRFGYLTVSHQLCEDIRRLLIRFGVVSSYRVRIPRAKGIGKTLFKETKPQHSITIRGIYADKLAMVLGINIKKPAFRRAGRSPLIVDGYVNYKITKIVAKQVKNLSVFNLEVEGDESYLANGVASHNCPPYHNLEVYSELPEDLSNCDTYEQFRAGIAMCAMAHFPLMKPGAFVCFVTGPFRDKKTGELIDFPGHTIQDFKEAGFYFHQNIILTKNFGSACIRSSNAWKGKKIIPLHEHLLVFRKPE